MLSPMMYVMPQVLVTQGGVQQTVVLQSDPAPGPSVVVVQQDEGPLPGKHGEAGPLPGKQPHAY